MLDDMDSSEFREMVIAECRGEAPEGFAEMLKQPENLERWRDALIDAISQAQNNVTQARADYEADLADLIDAGAPKARRLQRESEYNDHRRAIASFRNHIDTRLREVKRLIAAQRHGRYVDLVQDERDRYRARLERIAEYGTDGIHERRDCACPIHLAREILGMEWIRENDRPRSA